MKNSIHHEISVPASPAKVYDALTNAEQFSAMSGGAPASIDPEEGGSITLFGDHVSGRQVELVPAKRVVQAWRGKGWPEGVHSIVHFELEPEGEGTKIIFDQHGHPADQQEHLDTGWHDNYWKPLKAIR